MKCARQFLGLCVSLPANAAEAHLSFGLGIYYGKAVLGGIGTEKCLEFIA
ncbi:MAG: hypothetical protein ABSG01_01100 [Anaerolineales bacterium]|jgi:hypothetical protein